LYLTIVISTDTIPANWITSGSNRLWAQAEVWNNQVSWPKEQTRAVSRLGGIIDTYGRNHGIFGKHDTNSFIVKEQLW